MTPKASQKLCWAGFWRSTGSHRTHLLRSTQPTTVAQRSGRSVDDLAAQPQGGVGDVLRAPGGGIVAPCRVLPAADRREAREASAMGRRIRRPLLGTTSIRPAYSRRRRPAEAIESLRNSWEPIDARAGRVQEDRSLCLWWRDPPNWDLSQKTSSSTTVISGRISSIRLVWRAIWPVGVLRPCSSKKSR